MKWYSAKKYKPCRIGDLIIFRLKSGYIQTGIFDFQKDRGYFFENEDRLNFNFNEITHFCIPDPIEVIE